MKLKIAEQLQLLRRERGLTQEDLAKVFNVSNQSISKWELGQSCPDISLLPEIADYFKVSVDELLGYKPSSSINSIYLQMNSLLSNTKDEERMNLIFRLSRLASICSVQQEKDYIEKLISDKKINNCSLSQNNGGVVVQGFNSIFISSFKDYPTFNSNTIRMVKKYLNQINDLNTLKVMFGLFEMNMGEFFNKSYPMKDIIEKVGLKEEDIIKAFENLEVNVTKDYDGNEIYSLALLHIVPILVTSLIGTEYYCNVGLNKN